MMLSKEELYDFLEEKVALYNQPKFIESDPIQVPHQFSRKEDIEIAAFLAATIAWGNRKMIIKNALQMLDLLDNQPYDFVINHQPDDLKTLEKFVHRTFNGVDFVTFIKGLQNVYKSHEGLETIFCKNIDKNSIQPNISYFKQVFFEGQLSTRTTKHVSDPQNGSAAKRLNMFLRWMVRQDSTGVDFGLWTKISPAKLSCPLDVHSGNVARKLGLLNRKQNDAKALSELDHKLRELDPQDPVKYDFALFGLGVFEMF
jgi:uncharacterized protein (TIGR02757 family)